MTLGRWVVNQKNTGLYTLDGLGENITREKCEFLSHIVI